MYGKLFLPFELNDHRYIGRCSSTVIVGFIIIEIVFFLEKFIIIKCF